MQFNTVKRYKFDLDKSPSQRWEPILNDFKDAFPKLQLTIESIMKATGVTGLVYSSLKAVINSYKNKVLFYDELVYISSVTGIEFEKLLLMQLLYEASAACTCIITKVNGKHVMVRTMDWDMPILKDITIELEFVKNGKTLFIAPTWVGCVGVFTVHIPEKYSIAINYRRTKPIGFMSLSQNVYRVMKMAWPISYLIRTVGESEMNYESAIKSLQQSDIVSPCYITLYNSNDKSCVITRDTSNHNTFTLSEKQDYIIQTNSDDNSNKVSEENILYSTERYGIAESLIKNNNNNWKDENSLLKNICVHPIINEETVYMCVMIPKLGYLDVKVV